MESRLALSRATDQMIAVENSIMEGLNEIRAESKLIEAMQDLKATSDAIEFCRPWRSKRVPIPI